MVRSNQAPANTQGEKITQGQEYLEAAIIGAMSELPIIDGLHRTSYTSIFPDAFNYLPVALRDTGHNSLDQSDAWGSALLDAVTQVV